MSSNILSILDAVDCSTYGKVAVIMGGDSSERAISLLSGEKVLASLVKQGANAHKFDPLFDQIETLKTFDRAVVMLHGRSGEGGIMQAVLEYLNIPYSSSGVMASAIGMNKYVTKMLWQASHIPVACGQLVTQQNQLSILNDTNLQYPLIIKPLHGGSTIGVNKAYNVSDLKYALTQAFCEEPEALVEQLIVGCEYSIPVYNNQAYPIIKIEAPSSNYDYNNKYFSDDTKYICPSDLSTNLINQINAHAVLAYSVIGATGIARIDFMVDSNNKYYFLEINTIGGMTEHSLIPQSFKATGIDFDHLCKLYLEDAGLKTY